MLLQLLASLALSALGFIARSAKLFRIPLLRADEREESWSAACIQKGLVNILFGLLFSRGLAAALFEFRIILLVFTRGDLYGRIIRLFFIIFREKCNF